jgi:hypothetical protein
VVERQRFEANARSIAKRSQDQALQTNARTTTRIEADHDREAARMESDWRQSTLDRSKFRRARDTALLNRAQCPFSGPSIIDVRRLWSIESI